MSSIIDMNTNSMFAIAGILTATILVAGALVPQDAAADWWKKKKGGDKVDIDQKIKQKNYQKVKVSGDYNVVITQSSQCAQQNAAGDDSGDNKIDDGSCDNSANLS